MSLIEINKITKIYDGSAVPVKALNELSTLIEPGEFTAIVGPSGSGKTTLLNMIGGLDVPTSGNIIIDNVDISTYKPEELVNFRLHHIGFVFQAYNLIPVFTARENVEFIMLLQGLSKEEREKRAVDLLNSVGLEDRVN
ncbi:MAG: ATP-binding cassette domain-containing protein, partial [Ignavibacteriaceae bacterium]